ncbi:MAG: DUF362 domain-containing protein [bacterium]
METERTAIAEFKGMESVSSLLELCRGLAGLSTGDRVLIKPNLVAWDDLGPYPPWGVLTTSIVMEGLCRALSDAGAGELKIGEGSIHCPPIGSSTQKVFDRLGYHDLAKKYGAKLVDFNRGEHQEVETNSGHVLKVAKEVFECDFFINVPVLKTHVQTVVSLGMKNLKGLLSGKSKRYCHHPSGILESFILELPELFPPDLTVLDGVYSLERGPLHFGRARRRDLLIAGRDTFAVDLLGAHTLGYSAEEVPVLEAWADRHGRSKDAASLPVTALGDYRDRIHRKADEKLEDIEQTPDLFLLQRRLPYGWDWSEDGRAPELYRTLGMDNIILPCYDHTLCTGCSYLYSPLMVVLMSASTSSDRQFEFLTGKTMRPTGEADVTFLIGNCQVDLNRGNPACANAVEVRGCPPRLEDMFGIFQENGLQVTMDLYNQYRQDIMKRYTDRLHLFPREHFFVGD